MAFYIIFFSKTYSKGKDINYSPKISDFFTIFPSTLFILRLSGLQFYTIHKSLLRFYQSGTSYISPLPGNKGYRRKSSHLLHSFHCFPGTSIYDVPDQSALNSPLMLFQFPGGMNTDRWNPQSDVVSF